MVLLHRTTPDYSRAPDVCFGTAVSIETNVRDNIEVKGTDISCCVIDHRGSSKHELSVQALG